MVKNDWRILEALADAEGYANDVGQRAKVFEGSLSQTLKRLEEAGLISSEERVPRTGLKPRRWYQITDMGRGKLAAQAKPSSTQRADAAEAKLEMVWAAVDRVELAMKGEGSLPVAWAELRSLMPPRPK